MTSPLPYDHPVRLGLRQLAGGDLEAALESAQLYTAEHGATALPAAALPGVLAGLKRKVLRLATAVGLLVAVDGGAAYQVRGLDQVDQVALAALLAGKAPAGAPSATRRPSETPEALKARQDRCRLKKREKAAASSTPSSSTAPASSSTVTPAVTSPVTTRCHDVVTDDVTTGVDVVTPPVTPTTPELETFADAVVFPANETDAGLVTALAHARGVHPLHPSSFQKGDGQDKDPAGAPAVTTSTVTPPEAVEIADPVEPMAALWSAVLGRPVTELAEPDRKAMRRRLEQGHGERDFRAAFVHALTETGWFAVEPPVPHRQLPRMVCSDRYWAECVRKGTAKLPPSERRASGLQLAGPALASAPPRPDFPRLAPSLPGDFFDRPGRRADREEPQPYKGNLYVWFSKDDVWLLQANGARTA